MAVHGELRPDDSALPLLVASAALSKADSAMTRPTGSVRIDNGDGTETWLGDAASETGGVVQWVNDTTPPARPIGVTATCQMGVVVASWAGELEEPIPADFSHVEVFTQKDGSSDVVDAGMLYGAGSVTLTGYAEGDLVDVWAVAYDDAHDESGASKPNASGKSDIATVVVEPVVSQQQLAAKADEILKAGKAYSDQLNSQIQTDVASAKKSIDSNTDAVKAAQKAADDAKTSIVQTASKVTSIDSSLSSTQSKVNSLDKSLSATQNALDSANTSIAQTANKVDSIDSSLSSAKSKLDSLDNSLSSTQNKLDSTASNLSSTQNKVSSLDSSLSSVKSTLDSTVSKVSAQGSVLDKANASITALQKTADGKNTIYIQETEPAHTALRPGDLWYLRSNYRTYWQGEPNASPSVMEIPSSRIRGIKIWDGSTFNDYVFVADKIVAENSVTTGLLAADAIYGKVLKGGEFITTNGRLKINDAGLVAADSNGVNTLTVDANSGAVSMLGALKSGSTVSGATVTGGTIQTTSTANRGVKITSGGLVAYDTNGNPTLAVDAASGAVSMKGSLMSGSTVSGATVTGGTVDAAEYQLHSGSTLVGKANSSGVYFGDALTYAKSGSTWKLSLKNAGLQASTVDGCTVTGGTVTGATVQTSAAANRGVKITSGGLAAYDTNGNPTLAVDAGTGSVSMLGTLKSGSTVSGATITGGTVDANEYQLHSGSELIGKANSSGVYFGDSLTYAKSSSTWKLSLKNAGLQASTVDGCTVTGGTIQTTTAWNRGVKITSGGLAAYDKNGAATLTVDANSGSIMMKGAVSTNSTLNAPAINSGTVTGAVIQTTATANRGVKITSSGISAYDGNGTETLHLDGSSNVISGILRTAAPGTGSYMEIFNEKNVVDSSNESSSNTGYIRSFDKYGAQTWQLMGWNYKGEQGGGANTGVELFVNSRCNIGLEYVANATGIVKIEADRFVCNSTDFTPSMITDADTIMTLSDSSWTWYTGGDATPRTWQMRMGAIAFTHLEFQRSGSVNSGFVAGRLNVRPTKGINVIGLHNNSPYVFYINTGGEVQCCTNTGSGWFALEFSYPVYVEPVASNTI